MVQLHPGQSFAGYTVVGVLGVGGMGSVYLAGHPRLPRQVALKLLAQEVSVDAEHRRRFEQEANAIARLDHPSIVGIHDRGMDDGHLWIAMQYIQGTDASRLDARQVSVERALRIITETAFALDFAHSRGVLHRDVKPANILLSAADTGRQERAILTDFGIARLLDANTQLTSTGTFTATLAYASPEQLSGEPVDHRTDQYSLGCTLFALLSGQSPFASTNPGQVVAGHIGKPVPRLGHIRRDVSPALDDVIARATAKRREDRYASCSEFAAAASAALTGRAFGSDARNAPTVARGRPPEQHAPQHVPAAHGQGAVPRAGRSARAPRTAFMIAVLLALVGGAFAAFNAYAISTDLGYISTLRPRVTSWVGFLVTGLAAVLLVSGALTLLARVSISRMLIAVGSMGLLVSSLVRLTALVYPHLGWEILGTYPHLYYFSLNDHLDLIYGAVVVLMIFTLAAVFSRSTREVLREPRNGR
ncbi:serine/threonine-protein kinase [Nocardia jejuensis]|uniref:serine/threonine-protein kinase n=1 Tax=Nocardia jejuensis TaxID=328049 RepID=UPI00082A037D|nr:serine/threonine-protein kinase [Nocardia jejuensis]